MGWRDGGMGRRGGGVIGILAFPLLHSPTSPLLYPSTLFRQRHPLYDCGSTFHRLIGTQGNAPATCGDKGTGGGFAARFAVLGNLLRGIGEVDG